MTIYNGHAEIVSNRSRVSEIIANDISKYQKIRQLTLTLLSGHLSGHCPFKN